MNERQMIETRAQAERETGPLISVLRQVLIESYVRGFADGVKSAENGQPDEEPLVRLKPDAVLKRRLLQEEFPSRVWNEFKELDINTLGDILQCSENFFKSRRGLGMGSINAIKSYVRSFGYQLKEK